MDEVVNSEDFVNEVINQLAPEFPEDKLIKIRDTLYIKLISYKLQKKKDELILFDNDNEIKLKKFIATKRLEGLSENTLVQYHRTITNLLDTLNKPINRITTDDIRFYLSVYHDERKVSKVTLNNMRRYFSSFFSWCCDEDIIDKNPMRRIKAIKQQKVIKEPFSDVEMEKIRESTESLRDRALIEFLYSTGCRVSEVVGLDKSNVDFIHNSVVVNGKGNKQREVYISDTAMYWIEKYLHSREDDSPALFSGKRTPRIQKAGIEETLRRIGRKSGVENVHPHRFRRTVATNLINRGMPVQEVQQILGHSKLDTTMIYCKVDKKNIQASHRKFIA